MRLRHALSTITGPATGSTAPPLFPATPTPFSPSTTTDKRGRKRGSYTCGRCGLPKKGHSCYPSSSPPPPLSPSPPPPRHPPLFRRRALIFDKAPAPAPAPAPVDLGSIKLPSQALAEVLRRLPPAALLAAAQVCKGWRDCARRVWAGAEELRISIGQCSPGFLRSVLQKCPDLVRLSLRIESNVDLTVLAYVAFACPNLEALEIQMVDTAVNRITGDELGRFVAESRSLSILKIEGCSSLGFLDLCSSSLATLWLQDLHSLTKMVFHCPNLKELSLDFSRQCHDSTDLCNMVENLGKNCPRLRNLHIASIQLSHNFVLALTSTNMRALRMLSLVLGAEITDASVAAIASSYPNLELLDLTGSSISDSGIGIICNVFPKTLSKLLLGLCPNITSSGIQFAAAQLPLLQVIDCGMAVINPLSQLEQRGFDTENHGKEHKSLQKVQHSGLLPICQKLIIKHGRLKKLSLWGCSSLDALYLSCPELNELNLNLCTNLRPEKLLLQCPSLETVDASGCQNVLVRAIQSQVSIGMATEDRLPSKRLADGSKRVQVPRTIQRPHEDEKRKMVQGTRCIVKADRSTCQLR